jgi:hypothetical protein
MNEFEHQEEQVFTVGEECAVRIESTSGDLTVCGWDRAEISLGDEDDNASIDRRGQTIHLRPSRGGSNDLLVMVPHRCEISVRTLSGDIKITEIEGPIQAQTMSGDIDIDGAPSELAIHSVSGDIKAMAQHTEKLKLDTVSGDVILRTALRESGDYDLHTVSGEIKMRLPQDQPCTVDFGSLSGDLRCDLPHTTDHHTWGKNQVQVNGGGVRVKIRTTSGSARLLPWGKGQPVAEPRGEPAAAAERPFSGRETRPLTEEMLEEQEPFGLDTEPEAFAEESAFAEQAAPAEESASAEHSAPSNRRMQILKDIEAGKLTVSEGLQLLRDLE